MTDNMEDRVLENVSGPARTEAETDSKTQEQPTTKSDVPNPPPPRKREIKSENPLAGRSRTGSVFVTLPSRGRWGQSPNTSELSHEIEVLPMTVQDEMAARNPSALINGETTRQIIRSCTGIINCEDLIKNDVEYLLAAITVATHGDDYGFQVECSSAECEANNKAMIEAGDLPVRHDVSVDLRLVVDEVDESLFDEDGNPLIFEAKVAQDKGADLVVRLSPRTFAMEEKLRMRQMEDASRYDSLGKIKDIAKRVEITGQAVNSQVAILVEGMADMIEFVWIPGEGDGTIVNDRKHILEWLKELPAKEVEKITAVANTINDLGFNHYTRFTCPDCGEETRIPIPLDASNFFGQG